MIAPLFEVFRSALMDNAQGSRKDAQRDFVARMKGDPEYLDILARDYFDRMSAQWTVRTEGAASKAFVRASAIATERRRKGLPHAVALVSRTKEEEAARTEIALAEMKAGLRGVILLDLVLPNGKALRNSTGAECAAAGGFFAAVAKHLRPSQVVDLHLGENDLQNIRARFYQKNRAAA